MDLSKIKEYLSRYDKNTGMYNTLGIEFISTPEPDTVKATMPVDDRNIQAFGYLCGGATLALGEILAGVGSSAICTDRLSFGMSVSCNHIRPVKKGNTVTAVARIIHRGHSSHVWNVEIRDGEEKLISTLTVTNFVTDKAI